MSPELTQDQKVTLKSAILAETDPAFVQYRNNGQTQQMADFFNVDASPAYYVRRKTLSRHEILTGTSDDGTVFSWAGGAYITRAQGERDAFREMFNDTGNVDPWLPTIQAAFNDIFSGAGGATNRTHIVAMSRRTATRAEKLFSTGAGTKVSPSVLGPSDKLTDTEIIAALSV